MGLSTNRGAKANSGLSPTRALSPELVKSCDLRALGALDAEKLVPVMSANEAFAHMLTEALRQNLNFACDVSVQSCQQQPSSNFLQKSGSANYLLSVALGPQHEPAFLQIEPRLLLPAIDLMLGGSGKTDGVEREITELEDRIVREFARTLCQVLQSAWQGFKVQIGVGERLFPGNPQTDFAAPSQVVACRFMVRLLEAETQGEFRLLIPVSSAVLFLRAVAGERTAALSADTGGITNRFAEALLDTNFPLELAVTGGKVRAKDLLNLKVGRIVKLDVPVRSPAVLKVGDRGTFQAMPVRSGSQKGAQLAARLPNILE
jgi:flagellar motor switch protein FliM